MANDFKVGGENENVGFRVDERRKSKHGSGSVSENDAAPGPWDIIVDATNIHWFSRIYPEIDLDAGRSLGYKHST